jgi:hypothetical protein
VLLFGEAIETPFEDLDAIEAYNWPVVDKYAHPFPVQTGLSERLTRPGKSDILRLEAALLALPRFVQAHMRAPREEPPRAAEETLAITMADGEDRIHLRYPVPGFERVPEDEWPFAVAAAEIGERNAELLGRFEQWLRDQGLSKRTVRIHLDNVERFADRYLAAEGGTLGLPCPADEAAPADVDEFLADWLLFWADPPLAAAVKSHVASLKKLYTCLGEAGQMATEDSNEILAMLTEDRAYYLDLARDFEKGVVDD